MNVNFDNYGAERTLLFHFHGLCIVWIEGSFSHPGCNLSKRCVY